MNQDEIEGVIKLLDKYHFTNDDGTINRYFFKGLDNVFHDSKYPKHWTPTQRLAATIKYFTKYKITDYEMSVITPVILKVMNSDKNPIYKSIENEMNGVRYKLFVHEEKIKTILKRVF